MTDLTEALRHVPTDALEKELKRRGRPTMPEKCPTCRVWPTRFMAYQTHYAHVHCSGCLRHVEDCTC